MKADFSIYLTDWGYCPADEWGYCRGDVRWVCESNNNGLIYAAFRTPQQAVSWCENNGYSYEYTGIRN